MLKKYNPIFGRPTLLYPSSKTVGEIYFGTKAAALKSAGAAER